ncbi:poly-gamma-glutamate hydrolase family protein [Staphylococcus sp. HMSC070D05]|uniref:poly-gamma-glutamate hydrolase family protein n=1 Tax=Staphylococcus sp. HMSC070D05 TaxID=1739538 RepID=UPI0008A480B3|nr:poly-gamma-glutamate hydrolase family protein [Staphylococcus sp. HMSC070D05]OFO42318.1 hypothetical protein HMPREF3046_06190 [Staphylococcus sp. HMSC070D05]
MKNKKNTYLSYSTKTFLGLAMTAAGIGAFGFAQNNAYAAEIHQVLNSSTQKENITKTTHSQVSTTKTSLPNTKPTTTSTQVPNTKHTTSTKSVAVKSAASTKPTTKSVTSKSTAPIKTTKSTTKKVTPKSTLTTKTPVTSKNTTLNKTQSTIVKKIDAPKISVTKTPSSTTTKRQITQTSKAPVMVTPPVYKLGSVKPTDYYRSMTDLLKDTQEGKDWTKESTNRHSNVLIFAPHGGNIEKGTTELTKAIANKGNYDYYAFNGTRNKNNSQLHVTSTNYNDLDLINRNYNKDVSISVHGAGQSQGKNTVLIGGRDEKLIQLISKELSTFKFNVQRSLGHLAGIDTNNVVNYNKKGQGVQLELTPDLRKSFFSNGDDSSKARKNEKNWTSTMDRFATAINNAIRKYMI